MRAVANCTDPSGARLPMHALFEKAAFERVFNSVELSFKVTITSTADGSFCDT